MECAVLLPLLLGLVLGVWEVGRMLEVHQLLTNAAREGGRLAAGGAPPADVTAHVRAYLLNAGLSARVVDRTTTTYDDKAKTAEGANAHRVVVSLRARDVMWVQLPLVTTAESRVTAECVWPRD